MSKRSLLRRISGLLLFMLLIPLLSGCTAQVKVEWSTETEMNTAGFNLLRGESVDGPFDVQINDQLIPPSNDPMTGGDYSFVDRTVTAGKTYFYQLQEVERTGNLNAHGPIEVQAGGIAWWQVGVLVLLACLVLAVWIIGGRRTAKP